MTLFTISNNSSKFDKKCKFLFNLYNVYAKKYGFRRAIKLTTDRKRTMSYVSECGFSDLFQFLKEFEKSIPFFQKSEWFDFDWIIKEDNYIKVSEGKYSRTFGAPVITSSVEYTVKEF